MIIQTKEHLHNALDQAYTLFQNDVGHCPIYLYTTPALLKAYPVELVQWSQDNELHLRMDCDTDDPVFSLADINDVGISVMVDLK